MIDEGGGGEGGGGPVNLYHNVVGLESSDIEIWSRNGCRAAAPTRSASGTSSPSWRSSAPSTCTSADLISGEICTFLYKNVTCFTLLSFLVHVHHTHINKFVSMVLM